MTQIFNTQIADNVDNVANGGSGISQEATVNVGPWDWDTLRRYLQSLGLQDTDLAGLQTDLDTARAAGTGMDGKPSNWVGKLHAYACRIPKWRLAAHSPHIRPLRADCSH